MYKLINLARLEETLRTVPGWIELLLVLACFIVAWIIDRHIRRRREAVHAPILLASSMVRFSMPLVALVLLLVGRTIWRQYAPSLFFEVGVILAVALAVIRMIVYVLRRIFSNADWLRTGELTIGFVIWALVALHVLGITPEIAHDLDNVRVPIGRDGVSVLEIIQAALGVIVTLTVTLWLSGLLESRLMKSTHLGLSQRALIAKFVRAVLLVIGVLVGFQMSGFDLTLLSVFGGALGVGIGLGLQRLASNFIAGFVILLDRSVRLGDLVTVDKRYGVVTEVSSRYVVVKGLDQVEALIPNDTLITTTVLNHSLSNRESQVTVQVQVAYGTDVERALEVLVEIGAAHPRGLKDPGRTAGASVLALGPAGINLEMSLWIRDAETGVGGLRSDLFRTILKRFADEGIRIPYTAPAQPALSPPSAA